MPTLVPPQTRFCSIGPFRLESGETLPEVEIAYEIAGTLAPDKGNVILVCHALTGNSHTVGTEEDPGWWDGLIGPGRWIDTNRYAIVTMNTLGGCSGSTGPVSIDPRTGRPYGSSFPSLTIRDMVRAQHACLERLGFQRVYAIIGGSMGGMLALEWAVMFPGFAQKCIPIATGTTLSALSMAMNEIGRQSIIQDPLWNNGNYDPERGPEVGLSIARMVGMVSYRTEALFERRFRDKECPREEVGSYLRYQGQKLVKRFDANTYLHFLQAMDTHDLGRGRGGDKAALQRAEAEFLVIGFTEDLYFPVRQQRELYQALSEQGKNVQYVECSSIYGHDAFLVDFKRFGPAIKQFLEG